MFKLIKKLVNRKLVMFRLNKVRVVKIFNNLIRFVGLDNLFSFDNLSDMLFLDISLLLLFDYLYGSGFFFMLFDFDEF